MGKNTGDNWTSLLTERTSQAENSLWKAQAAFPSLLDVARSENVKCTEPGALFAMGKVGSRHQYAFKSQQYTRLAVKKGKEAAFQATGVCRIWTEVFTHHPRLRAAGKALQTLWPTALKHSDRSTSAGSDPHQISPGSHLILTFSTLKLSTVNYSGIKNTLHCHFSLLHFTSDWPWNPHPTTRFRKPCNPRAEWAHLADNSRAKSAFHGCLVRSRWPSGGTDHVGPSVAAGAPSCWPSSSCHQLGTKLSSSEVSAAIWARSPSSEAVKVGHPEQRAFEVWLHWRWLLETLWSKLIKFKISKRSSVEWSSQNCRALSMNFHNLCLHVTQRQNKSHQKSSAAIYILIQSESWQ